jgi:uncharacterized protein YkwD
VSSRRTRRATAAAAKNALGVLTVALTLVVARSAEAVGHAAAPQTRPRGVTAAMSRYERDLLARVNAVRARHNRALLIPSPGLMAAAELHTRRMIRDGFFDHEAPGERPFWNRIERFYPSAGYDYWAVGENLAYGSPTLEPAEVLHEWFGSAKHRRSLLAPDWREAGLAAIHVETAPGEYEGEPATVVTLDLGVRRG